MPITCVGMLCALRWPLAGAIVILGDFAGFYLWNYLKTGSFPSGPWFALVASPSVVFLLAWSLKIIVNKLKQYQVATKPPEVT